MIRKFMLVGSFPFLLLMILIVSITTYAATPQLVIDPSQRFQTIDGFGASIAFLSNEVFVMKEPYRSEVLDLLFKDLGTTILRLRTNVDTEFTNDNDDPFVTNWENLNFKKDAAQVWTAKQALARGVKTIVSSTWSAPPWMKTNNMLHDGGHVRPECIEEFAEWVTAYVKGYNEIHGIPIDVFSLTNEPDLATAYDSMLVTPDEYVQISQAIRRRFEKEKINTRLTGPETMGSLHTITEYVPTLLAEPRSVDILGTHLYAENDLPGLARTAEKYQIPVWVTEWSKLKKNEEKGIDESLTLATMINDALAIGNVNAFLYWGYWWNETTPEGLIIASGFDSWYETTKRYYMFKQFSKFIRPGAVRIAAQSDLSNLKVSAYQNGDNLTVVIINKSNSAKKLELAFPGEGNLSIYETSADKDCEKIGAIKILSKSSNTLNVPANSIITLDGPWKHDSSVKYTINKLNTDESSLNGKSSFTQRLTVADFEQNDSQLGSYNGPNSQVSVSLTNETVYEGSQAVKVEFLSKDWIGATLSLSPSVADWSKMTHISFWMYGNSSGNPFNFVLEDNNLEQFQFSSPARIDWTGWKQLLFPLSDFKSRTDWQASNAKVDGTLDSPIKGIHFFTSNSGQGTVYFDKIEVLAP